MKLDVRGEEVPRQVAEGARFPHVSSDGRYLVYEGDAAKEDTNPSARAAPRRQRDIFYLGLESDSLPQVFLEGPASETQPRISPDVRYVAYISNESGRNELYVRRFPSGEGRRQISTDGGFLPRWSVDGDELFYLRGRELMAVPVSTGGTLESGEPKKLFTLASPGIYEYSVTRDGQFVVVQPGEETSTIAVVDQWQSFFEATNE